MTAQLPAHTHDLGHGVYAIDTGFCRDHFDAAYLMVQGGHALFVDTGTNHSVPRLLEALQAVGLGVDAVDHVIPTHVHLDHAGGVGLLMQHLPRATVWVHERGARHIIDPTALYLGATAVYGAEEMERSYGKLLPVAAERVMATHDGQVLDWHGRRLEFMDTPGHARHHHCLWDGTSQGWFTGDTFGLSYREFDGPQGAWIMPTTTPVQFEPEALKHSIGRLLSKQPRWMYLTHYSRVGDAPAHAQRLLRLIDAMVALGRAHRHVAGAERHALYRAGLTALLQDDLRDFGYPAAQIGDGTAARLLDLDIELNAQGLAIWADKQA